MAAEVESPGDGGDRTTEGDMLGTDWDKGRPWAGRTEQDVGTEWLRRLRFVGREVVELGVTGKEPRGERSGRQRQRQRQRQIQLRVGDAEAKYNGNG